VPGYGGGSKVPGETRSGTSRSFPEDLGAKFLVDSGIEGIKRCEKRLKA